MIHLRSIEISNFKGVERFQCDLDDLTVLVGLNNSGKTIALQAIYLLFAAIPKICGRRERTLSDLRSQIVTFDAELSSLGLRDTKWLSSLLSLDVEATIAGTFSNSLRIELALLRNTDANVAFSMFRRESRWSTVISI